MTHRVSHKKLSRDTNSRRALIKNLATSLILHERIVTTTAKAKTVRPYIEKLITKAKTDSIVTRRHLNINLDKKSAVDKMLELIGPTFKDRAGGYTRILRTGQRSGDRAEKSIIEFVENISETAAKRKVKKKETKKESEETTKTVEKNQKETKKIKATAKKKDTIKNKKETSKK